MEPSILREAIPSSYLVRSWRNFNTLIETEMPLEELNQALEHSRPSLDELILEWKTNLESYLISALPEQLTDSQEGDISGSRNDASKQASSIIPECIIALGNNSEIQSFSGLSSDTQRLLRANCVFIYNGLVKYYPDDFHGWHLTETCVAYDPSVAKIANALLASLRLPNVPYLRLKAVGNAFVCGRCTCNRRMTWKETMQHYVDEENKYASVQTSPHVLSITYIHTHDVSVSKPYKPLLNVIDTKTPQIWGRYRVSYQECLMCEHLGVTFEHQPDVVSNHLRDVHLIESPKLNEHYRRGLGGP
ncbi:hypothetical protein FRC12_022231 [Ceratobasidium sp. 428]|nr:hypothetical protein FRC12_022231 [Ceratobasidium sp. 428]